MPSYLCSLALLLSLSLELASSIDDPPPASPNATAHVTNNDITAICSETQDPSFCWRALKSNPEATRNATLQALASNVIDAALANAISSYDSIGTILNVTNDHDEQRTGYIACSQVYFRVVEVLKSAKRLLAEGDFLAVGILSSSVAEDADACELVPETKPSFLSQRNDYLKRYGSIISAISDRLMQSSG